MVSKEHLEELKKIFEEDYQIKLTDEAVKEIANFLIAYVKLLKKVDVSEE